MAIIDKEKSCVKVLIYVTDLPTVGYGSILNNVSHFTMC